MIISKIMKKMISYSEGNLHDIHHFMLVWSYAKTIGELEKLDTESQLILEIAAILHDIACPLCRRKRVFRRANQKFCKYHLQNLVGTRSIGSRLWRFTISGQRISFVKKMPLQKGEYPKK